MEKKKSEKKPKVRLKTVIAISIGILAVLSALIFIGSRGESQNSIAIEFTTQVLDYNNTTQEENNLVAGKEVLLTFRLTDNRTGKPIPGLNPEINFYMPGEHDPAKEHKHLDGQHFTGKLNMAKLQLFVLNSDKGTIEVLDAFGSYDPRPEAIKSMGSISSKVIMLKGSPRQRVIDMVASRYGDYLYATLLRQNQVAVVNTISHEVVKYIDVGAMPGRMFLQPKSKYLWVSNDGGGSVSIIDTTNNTLAKTIDTGKGYHQIAFSPENAYITNSEYNTVSVIRLDDFTKIRDIKVDRVPYGIDFSNASSEVYVANIFSGTVTVIDASTQKIKKHIPLRKGIETIKFSPDGRRGVVLDRYANATYIIDAMTGSLIKTVKTGEAPHAVEFMEDYAIVRNSHSNDVTYISMINPELSDNEPVGTEPPINVTPRSLQTIDNEVVITGPREGMIYFMHKMNGQPMVMTSARVEYGSDSVAIVENKLHETSPGTYQQYIILDREGPYVIEFTNQRINSTFRIDVLPDQTTALQTVALFNKTLKPGISSTLQYRVTDKRTGLPIENLTDMTYLIIKPVITSKGTWTERLSSKHIGNGTYEAKITFLEEGEYMITLISNTLQNRGYETTYDYVTVKNTLI